MKKLSLLNRFMVILFAMLTIGVNQVLGASKTVTLGPWDTKPITGATQLTVTGTLTDDAGKTWSATLVGEDASKNPSQSVNSKYWQIGQNGNKVTATFSTGSITDTITAIDVDCAAYQGKGEISVTVGGTAFGTQAQAIPTWASSTGGVVSFKGSAKGEIVITMNPTSDGRAIYFKSAAVTYSYDATEPSLQVTPSSIDFGKVDQGSTSVQGKEVTVTIENIEEVLVGFSTSSPFEVDKESLTASGKVTITPKATTLAAVGEYKDTLVITDADKLTEKVPVKINVIDPSTKPVLHEVNTIANLIACYDAGVVSDNDYVKVTGFISAMFLKPNNFAKYGSATIWICSTEEGVGTAKEFQLYNCYGYNGDTLVYFGPGYTATGSSNVDVDTIISRMGAEYVDGDSIVAYGKIKKYNTTYELDGGCYIVSGGYIPTAIFTNKQEALPAKKMILNGQVVFLKDGKMYNALGVEL